MARNLINVAHLSQEVSEKQLLAKKLAKMKNIFAGSVQET